MNCPTCAGEMVTAKATSFGEEYWYCRSCRKELSELSAKARGAGPYGVPPTGLAAWAGVDNGRIGSVAPNHSAAPQSYPPAAPCYVSGGKTVHNFPSFVPGVTQKCACGAQSSLMGSPVPGTLQAAPVKSLHGQPFFQSKRAGHRMEWNPRGTHPHCYADQYAGTPIHVFTEDGAYKVIPGEECECGKYYWDSQALSGVAANSIPEKYNPYRHASSFNSSEMCDSSMPSYHKWPGPTHSGTCNCGKVAA